MTASSLTNIQPGDDADATVLMNNFTYLKNRADANTTNITNAVSNFNTIVYNSLSVYQDVNTLPTSGTIALESNTINEITPTGNVTFTLPTITDNTKYYQILVMLRQTSTYNVSPGTNYYFTGEAPNVRIAGYYDLIFEYDKTKSKWCYGAVKKAEVS